ncbi:MAG: hypothetical protein ACI8ZN_000773 [Bacteroidia bacterium]
MPSNKFFTAPLVVLMVFTALLVGSGCAIKHRNIPRTWSSPLSKIKQKTIPHTQFSKNPILHADFEFTAPLDLVSPAPTLFNEMGTPGTFPMPHNSDSEGLKDHSFWAPNYVKTVPIQEYKNVLVVDTSLASKGYEPKKKKNKSAVVIFGVALAANVLFLAASGISLIMLFLLLSFAFILFIYLMSKLITEMKSRPVRYKPDRKIDLKREDQFRKNSRVATRFFKIGVALVLLASLFALGEIYALFIFFGFVGLFTLMAGILILIINLVLKLV